MYMCVSLYLMLSRERNSPRSRGGRPDAQSASLRAHREVGGRRLETSSACVLATNKPVTGFILSYMHEKQKGTVSSNSRFQTVILRQYSANLPLTHATSRTRTQCSPLADVMIYLNIYIYIYTCMK